MLERSYSRLSRSQTHQSLLSPDVTDCNACLDACFGPCICGVPRFRRVFCKESTKGLIVCAAPIARASSPYFARDREVGGIPQRELRQAHQSVGSLRCAYLLVRSFRTSDLVGSCIVVHWYSQPINQRRTRSAIRSSPCAPTVPGLQLVFQLLGSGHFQPQRAFRRSRTVSEAGETR